MTSLRFLPSRALKYGAQTWRAQGKLFATVVVKATFGFSNDGKAFSMPADDVRTIDRHLQENPTRSLADCSDLEPFLARGEVLYFGSVHGPSGGASHARLSVVRDGNVLVDKTIMATIPASGAAIGEIPATYENAYGGAAHPWNPVGRADPPLLLPSSPTFPAALGPIAPAWPARAELLRPEDVRGLHAKERALEDGIEWSYFQAAPPDQRLPGHFQGNEIVYLESLWPAGGRRKLALPNARVELQARRAAGQSPVALTADRLRVDSDRECVSLTWRGNVELADEKEVITFAAVLSMNGEVFTEEETIDDAREEPFKDEGTQVGPSRRREDEQTLPFLKKIRRPDAMPRPAPSAIPGAPWVQPEAPKPKALETKAVLVASMGQEETLAGVDLSALGAGIDDVELRKPTATLSPSVAPAAAVPPAAVPPAAVPPAAAARDFGVVQLPAGRGSQLLLSMVAKLKQG